MHKMENKHIWMETGNFNDNSLRFIDITLLANKLGPQLSQSLPAFHAFTGCDYSPAFVGKGKIRPFKLLEKYPIYQTAFCDLESGNLTTDLVKLIQGFVCNLYGNYTCDNINEALVQHFFKAFKSKKNASNWLNVVKGSDGASFPPCYRVLYQHILRTEYVACMWKNNADVLSPLDFGWELDDGMFEIKWFDGEQYPSSIDLVMTDNDNNDNEIGENQDDDLQQYASDEDEGGNDDDDDNDNYNMIY